MYKRKFPFGNVNPIQTKIFLNSKVFNEISCSSEKEKKIVFDRTLANLKDGCKVINPSHIDNVRDENLPATKFDKYQMTIKFDGQLSRSPMKIAPNQSTCINLIHPNLSNDNVSIISCLSCKLKADETSTCAWCNVDICNRCCHYCLSCSSFYCHLCSVLEYRNTQDQEAFCLQCIRNNNS